jgi:hypothetical protein
MGLILCGGGSEIEVHINRDMIVDALNSVKMAMEHGMLVKNIDNIFSLEVRLL